MEKEQLWKLAREHVSFYLYDEETIQRSAAQLLRDFPGIRFLYSVKANHHPQVVKCVLKQGFGVDAASLREVQVGVENGLGPGDIYYSAPGKTCGDIKGAIGVSTLIADSISEVSRIQAIAAELGVVASIGLRLNPAFSFHGDKGNPSKFGIDADQAMAALPLWNTWKNITVTGIHVHLQSQELDVAVLEGYYRQILRLAWDFQTALGHELEFINMGSGIGIPYSPQDLPLDTARLGQAAQTMLQEFRTQFPLTEVLIETGRYVTGKAGVYVTQVLDRKISHGKTFLILANTLNGFLRPSLAQLVGKYTKEERPAGCEPLFTSLDAFRVIPLPKRHSGNETVTLAGNLCTAADIIASDVELPRLEPGDLLILTNAGSYAAVLSPMQFSSQPKPAELFLHKDGTIETDTPV